MIFFREKRYTTIIKNMSSATNPVTESSPSVEAPSVEGIRLTPAEAFWQTDIPIPQKNSVKSDAIQESKGWNGWNRHAWNRKRTPSEIANHETMREAEQYSMMCIKPGCVMYGTFDKCVHNILLKSVKSEAKTVYDFTAEQRKEAYESAVEILNRCKSSTPIHEWQPICKPISNNEPIVWRLCQQVVMPDEQVTPDEKAPFCA